MTGCKANGCPSCGICDDGRTIEVDCLNVEQPGQWYYYGCDRGYTGSFANTFDFGTIKGGTVEEGTTHDSAANSTLDQEEFCWDLADLESHMIEKVDGMVCLRTLFC